MMISAFTTIAQGFTKGDIIVKTSPSPHKGRVVLQSIENLYEEPVGIVFINEYEQGKKRNSKTFTLKKGEKQKWDVTFNAIVAKPVNSQTSVEIFRLPKVEEKGKSAEVSEEIKAEVKNVTSEKKKNESESKNDAGKNSKGALPVDSVINGFRSYLNSFPFLSSVRLQEDSLAVARHLANLNLPSINKAAYIEDEGLDKFVREFNDSITLFRNDSTLAVAGYLERLGLSERKDSYEELMLAVLHEKIEKKSAIIEPLTLIVEEDKRSNNDIDWKFYIVCGGVALLCLMLIIWYRKVSKKNSAKRKKAIKNVAETGTNSSSDNGPSLVVVGTKSATVLKKQSLDDVYNNESYLKIETSDFCGDSKVRALYIKNSCVKDIYNMYAEDLRNPENPKEDGCMVVGRWVYDEESGKYDVSLEYIILPGDDAVFEEYELNFGGKIKLKMSERLRKLRRETGLQYDLTCWVHSHPGLGVFFSNSDNNVHHQLKHPSHPDFLTALVIDILTPQQDMGIFTFKETEEVNSRNDLMKLYSLEEMYKWALASERRSFDTNDYFDILGNAKTHSDICYGVQLSNSAIIDMTFLTSKPNGFCGFAHGYLLKRGDRTQCIVSVVNGNESAPNSNMLGCFVVASHCSIPSLRKLISRYLRDIHFVLVYTVSDGLLTAIPIVDNDLINNEAYYGEKKLEDLKIWTRRRR